MKNSAHGRTNENESELSSREDLKSKNPYKFLRTLAGDFLEISRLAVFEKQYFLILPCLSDKRASGKAASFL